MSGKEALQMVLNGQSPKNPPHWELVFQIEKEMFGLDIETATDENFHDKYIELHERVINEFSWAAVPGGYDPELIARVKKDLGDKALVASYDHDGVFWMPNGENIMDFVIRIYEKKDELLAEARDKCDRFKEHAKKCVDAGADFFVLTYDFGFNDAPFVSPDQFGEIVVPYLTEIVDTIRDLGSKSILHSDGCLTDILDHIHSTGIDGYQSVDPQGHMDIKEVREKYPDWILMGNVACNMLQDGTEEQIRKSVQYCMTHGGIGKPYIFSTSNCIFKGMPVDNYKIMLDEYHKMCAKV